MRTRVGSPCNRISPTGGRTGRRKLPYAFRALQLLEDPPFIRDEELGYFISIPAARMHDLNAAWPDPHAELARRIGAYKPVVNDALSEADAVLVDVCMALPCAISLGQFIDSRFEERRIEGIPIEAELLVRLIPGLRQQRLLDAHPAADRAAPARGKKPVPPQVRDHAPRAVGHVGFGAAGDVRTQDREQPVLPWLHQPEPLRLLLGRGQPRRDFLELVQSPGGGLVACILAFLDALKALSKLPVNEARIVLGQLARQERLERRRLVGRRGEPVELAHVVLVDLEDRQRLREIQKRRVLLNELAGFGRQLAVGGLVAALSAPMGDVDPAQPVVRVAMRVQARIR